MQCELNSSLVLSKNNLEWSNKQVWPSRFDTIGISMLRSLIEISVKMRIEARLHAVIVISSDEEEPEDEEVLNEECEDDGEEIGDEEEEGGEDDYDLNDPFIDDSPQDHPKQNQEKAKKKPKQKKRENTNDKIKNKERKLYQHLEVDMDCSKELMKKKYKQLSIKWHPDKNNSPNALGKMQLITMAYRILMNDQERRKYGEFFQVLIYSCIYIGSH